jgi:hypothetical protein
MNGTEEKIKIILAQFLPQFFFLLGNIADLKTETDSEVIVPASDQSDEIKVFLNAYELLPVIPVVGKDMGGQRFIKEIEFPEFMSMIKEPYLIKVMVLGLTDHPVDDVQTVRLFFKVDMSVNHYIIPFLNCSSLEHG